MGQAIIRKLRDDALEAWRAYARERGSSLEAELRQLIETHKPLRKKPAEELRRMSDEALAMTPPDGAPPAGTDSTLLIRWDRDTDHGKWVDDSWSDD